MSNHHLRNKELSLKAKGLLSQMLSLPEDWDYTLAGLSYINREKIDAIREAVRELERAGYIQRSRERDEKGRLRGTDYIIYEQPPNLDLPTLENPTLGNPTLENPTQEKPTLENPMQLNKDIQKTDLSKKEKSNTDLSSNHSIPILSPNPSPLREETAEPERKGTEAADAYSVYEEIIKDNMLNDRGIPNPTEYKRLHGLRYQQPKTRNSTLWKYFAISDMLINEIYIGNMVQGKYGSVSYKTKQNKPRPKSEWYIVEGTHEPIIDRELWDRVQALIEQRAKPFDVGTIGLFARKARCANCGYTMRSSKNHNKHYLQCSNRHVAKDACIGSFISVDKLEKMLIDELNRLAAEYLDKDELEQNIEFCDNLQGQKKRLLSDLTVYQKKVDEYSKGIRELYMDKVKGLISESDYVDMSKGFTTERDRLERVIADGEKQLAEIEEKIAAGDNRRELIEQYTNLEHLTREIVETLIDYISVGKRIPGTRDVPIEIHWNF